MQALISLIAATGLRVGEALALDRGDAGLIPRHADRDRQERPDAPGATAPHHRCHARRLRRPA